jgi:Arc/MetJ-type ribon-helix-helix transcriptional regulator
MAQLVTRVDDRLARDVDRLVADGVVRSRSDAVRLGLEQLVDRHRRDTIGARIVDGYLRQPQEDGDVGWPDQATVAMIADEPW